ncbi:hypothetical protein BH09MYX1_BH09MYX1_60050 [soil metagenome]
MKRLACLALALALTASVGACSDDPTTTPTTDASADVTTDGSAPSDSATASDGSGGDAGSFCNAKRTRDEGCSQSFDPTACLTLQTCIEGALRPASASGYETCLVTRACNVNDDKCIGDEEAKFASDPTTVKFRQDCIARRSACLEGGTAFADDNCAVFGVFTDPFRTSWNACLAKPCDQISACFGALGKSQSCK